MGLKLAVGGKGGVGKTTVSALLARTFAAQGKRVYAVDADPVANLAAALGVADAENITPIAALHDLIHERTGTRPGSFGGIFKMNPKVEDLPERFSRERDGVRLLVMGTVKGAGSGCVCPESVMLKSLVQHLVLERDEIVIMDMEAGVEHLGRATAQGVDLLLIVVDPGSRSLTAAVKIRGLGEELKIKHIAVVANRVRNPEDLEAVRRAQPGMEIIGTLPLDEEIARADRAGVRPFEDGLQPAPDGLRILADKLLALAER